MFLSLGARWTYACHDLINVAQNSLTPTRGYTVGSRLEILRVYAPLQTDPLARVYIDQFTFSSEDISGRLSNESTVHTPLPCITITEKFSKYDEGVA